MPIHLTLLDDAVAEFLDAFSRFRRLTGRSRRRDFAIQSARCIRSLYVAIEKLLKHALAERDPYLVVEKLDAKLLLTLVRDRHARPVPNLLCARPPFETISASRAWALTRSELLASVNEADRESFERSFLRLCDIRHRAQHGEVFEEPDTIYATIEQVFAGIRVICDACVPQFLQICYRKNAQLRSRLVALEAKVDGSWQVFIDYLRARREPLSFTCPATSFLDMDGTQRIIFFKSEAGNGAELLMKALIPAANASGIFARPLTPSEAQERQAERLSTLDGSESTNRLDIGGLIRLVQAAEMKKTERRPLPPLETGELVVPSAAAWLTMRLPRMRPPLVALRFLMHGFTLRFAAPDAREGSIHGLMLPPAFVDPEAISYVPFSGHVLLHDEMAMSQDQTRDFMPAGGIVREFTLRFVFGKPRTITVAGGEAAHSNNQS